MTALRAAIVGALCAAAGVSALRTPDARFLVWPPAKSLTADGLSATLDADFSIAASPASAALPTAAAGRLTRAMQRAQGHIADQMALATAAAREPLTPPAAALTSALVTVRTTAVALNADTDYSYSLRVAPGDATVRVTADSIYGAMAGLESLVQLVERDEDSGTVYLPHTSIAIDDAPSYAWRGLMIDSGRRFFPVPVVQNILDTMSANKMSVLHLHASDMCRFGVQSNVFPNLTDALTGILAGYYTQADVAGLIGFAGDRGIRVVPEFDVPGHSRGFIPITAEGAVFCAPTDPTRSQLYGDPANSTLGVIQALFHEMAGLFTDDVFHIGCDETAALGPCTVDSTFALERSVLDYVQGSLNKTAAGWEEVLFDAGAATPTTTVFSWSRHWPPEVTATGHHVVASNGSHFYMTDAAPGGPSGWSPMWYDISDSIPSNQLPLLLGGELSQWTDTYCFVEQCGAFNGPTPYAAALFSPQYDTEFGYSIGGMMWPRGYVGAAAFWNYNASVSASDPGFVAAIWSLNTQLAERGSWVCPTNCSCDQLTACGVPYIAPTPPSNGAAISAQPCIAGVPVTQKWALFANGTIALAGNTSLCLQADSEGVYPLALVPCAATGAAGVWTHDASTSELVATATGACMDLRESDGAVGTWTCGSGSGLKQLNQEWAVDTVSGVIVSLLNGSCVTAAAAA